MHVSGLTLMLNTILLLYEYSLLDWSLTVIMCSLG